MFGPLVPSTNLDAVDNIHSTFITSTFNSGGGKATALGATKGKSWSVGGTATVGIGPIVCLTSFSLGANFDYSQSSSSGVLTLIDLDGDGLCDKVFKEGNRIYYRKMQILPDGKINYGPKTSISGISSFLEESSDNISWGLQASAGLSLSGGWPTTRSTTSVYFADVNGDGLPDLVNDTEVLFNALNANGVPYFTSFSTLKAQTSSPEQSDYIIVDTNRDCGGFIFDGEVNDSIACRIVLTPTRPTPPYTGDDMSIDSIYYGDYYQKSSYYNCPCPECLNCNCALCSDSCPCPQCPGCICAFCKEQPCPCPQ
jgi:hypothetical protein